MHHTMGGPFGPESPDEPSYADQLAEIEEAERERDAAIDAEGPAWPSDDTLEDWAQPSEPGDVWYIDDPWAEAAPPVLGGMSLGEWMVWLPELRRAIDAAIDDMYAAALAALEG